MEYTLACFVGVVIIGALYLRHIENPACAAGKLIVGAEKCQILAKVICALP